MAKKAKVHGRAAAFEELADVVQKHLRSGSYHPSTIGQLSAALCLSGHDKPLLRQVLKELVARGVLAVEGRRYSLWKSHQIVMTGVIHIHARGFGFVQPDDPIAFPADVFIPKHLTRNAVDGDNVEVLVLEGNRADKGPEGRVLAVLKRARTHIAGIVCFSAKRTIYAYAPLLGADRQVRVVCDDDEHLGVGDRIIMEVLEWGSKTTETVCRLSHVIGHITDPSCDIAAAIEEYGLRDRFSMRVQREIKGLVKTISAKEITQREDFRDDECFTIDPDTARDFDDALTLSKDKKGHYHLGVHIADVSYFVKRDSALDAEARHRCNSTYFPGRCLPMLPEVLSADLCSLKPKVNRLTLSVLMTFNKKGELLSYRIVRGVIRSKKRFTYGEVKKILDGKKKSPHAPTLKLMVTLCDLLKKQRYLRGSLEFSLPETVIVVDDAGEPMNVRKVEYDITHQMVEEFMLKANEIVAKHLIEQEKGVTFRIHEEPTEENIKDFSALATAFGFNLPEKPSPYELQKLFDEALKTPYGQHLAISYIRRMKQAYYSPNNIGHYGLSLEHYCHFTSPIRRYVDLVAHRALLGEDHDVAHLEEVAERCSECERVSAKAEIHVSLLKKLRLLQKFKEQEPYRQYDAVITRITGSGIGFEVVDFMVDGFLHVSELEQDYFVFNEKQKLLEGKYSNIVYGVTESITVMVKDVDLVGLRCHWCLVSEKSIKTSKRKPGRRPKSQRRRRRS